MSTRTRGEARHRAAPDTRARTRRRTALLSVPALVGALSGIVAPAQAAVGDFSIDFVGAAPYSYNHLVGGGAFDDRTVGKNADIVESLEAVDFACGDVVTYLSQIVVDDTAQAGTDAPQTIELDYEFLMDTTGASGVAIGDITYVGVNYAPVVDLIAGEDSIDQGNKDDGGSVATLVYENQTGPMFTAKSVLQGTVEVTDLERNEEVIVRIDVRLYCDPGSDPTGNLQGAITAGRLTYVNGATPVTPPGNISVGNQTVPFLQFGNLHWPELVIQKTVTDEGGTCPGVESLNIDSGETVKYCYTVTNPSNVSNPPGASLYDVTAVTDDNRTPGDTSDDFTVLLTGLTDIDGDGQLDDLAAGGVVYAEALVTVTAAMTGTYTNTASVSGYTFPGDTTLPLADTDTAAVVVTFIPAPAISIAKTTNGSDGPTILLGQPVSWSYLVTNTGNVDLANVSVSDDQGVTVTCPATTLGVGEAMTCTAAGEAVAGDYSNIGTASGDYGDMTVTATDPSSYFGADPQIEISKSPDTQTVIYGQTATFTIVVTNTGNVDLTDVAVTDAMAPACDAVIGDLAAGASHSYDCTYANVTADLTNVAVASGMYGDTAVSHEDDAAVVVDILPDITVSKTASPLEVPETGGDVTFTIAVTNNSTEPFILDSLVDDRFGDLDGQGTCALPQTIAAGGDYTCAITQWLASDSLAPHTNWVTAAGADEQGNPDSATDDATVTFTDVAPDIQVTKTASPSSVPETGGDVTFTFLVENIGVEDVTLTSLTDTVFGDLFDHTLNPSSTCESVAILVGGSYSCSLTASLSADDLASHYNVTTAVGTDDDGTTDTDTDDETVLFDDVMPAITVTKTADPTSVPETGGLVTFTYLVENTGPEDVTLTSLVDDRFGDLNGMGTCVLPQEILVGGSYSCTYGVLLFSDALAPHTNVVTATAEDDDGNEAAATDDETVTFTDVAPLIEVVKTANPTSVPETGGDVTFTFVVNNLGYEDVTLTSLTDTVFGDLAGKGTCELPQTILVGGSYSCEYTVNLSSDSLAAHHNVTTATAVDDDDTPATDDDDETVTFDDVAPDISVTKTASPTHVPETGGDVTFTFLVENIGVEDVTLTSLTDSVFGDLDGQGDCVAGGLIPVGGSYSCSLTVSLSADDLVDHYNVTTAVGTDDDGTTDEATDDETVTFDDVAPAIRVTKTADPTSVPETGGDVTFTFLVENIGVEDVTLTSLTDSVFGDLDGQGTCALPQTILIGGSYSCELTQFLASDSLSAHYNVTTATAVDDDDTPATDDDDETVTFDNVAPMIEVLKTANPTNVPETGGYVEFTFLVTNTGQEDVTLTALTDTVFGDLNGQGTCATPQTILIGASYSCSITEFLSADDLEAHHNVTTANAEDDDNTTATDDDDETVTFDDVLPDIMISKSALPTSVPETGADVEFTLIITNGSLEDATIDSLVDSDFDLAAHCPDAVGTVLPFKGSLTCTFTEWVAGDFSGISHENTATVVASDDDGNADTASDDETVTFTDVLPDISVTKTASPSFVPETGGDVTFTFLVENIGVEDVTLTSLTDSVFGDLNGQGDCVTGGLIPVGGSYSCSLTVFLSADDLADHYNVTTAVGTDDDGTTDEATDDETVTFDDVAPDITVTKTADPTHVPETGGDVTFTFLVENIGVEDVTLTSLTDTVFGDLNGQGDCVTGGLIPIGGSYTCSLTEFLASDSLTDHYNVTTAVGTDDDGTSDEATDDETVTFDDVAPDITVTKTADPTHVPETGGDVTFTFLVENIGVEDVTLTSLTDSVFGDLNGQGTCVTGGIIPIGGSYTCSLTEFLASDSLTDHYNVTTAVGTDDDGTTDEATDDETVTFDDVLPTIEVMKTASEASVPETGGDVVFTFVVKNTSTEAVTITSLTDSVYGPLAGDDDCAVGTVLPVGASCEFAFTQWVEGDYSGPAHSNLFTAVAVDNDGSSATDDDSETVGFTDVPPDITVAKTADPTHVPETGGDVTFTFLVENIGVEDVTLTSLTDTVFGDLNGQGDCVAGGLIPIGGSYTCSIVKFLASDSLTDHYNVTTAVGTDDDGTTDTATDDETVTFDDVAPDISLTKTASPTHVPETGGDVTFTFLVENIGVEDVTLTSLSDTVFGDLNGQGDCVAGGLIPVGGSYTCSIVKFLASDSLTDHYNVSTAVGTDDDGTTDTATDDETVTFDDVAPDISLTKTASPTHVPETGGDVTFTFLVENIGVEDVTLTSLSDTVFGDLNGQGTCVTGGIIPVGGSYSCSITTSLSSDSLTDHYNVSTAVGTDDDGTTDTATDDETVTFDDVAPEIQITKTADPGYVLVPGGNVTFTFLVENIGVEDVTLTSLNDTVFGDLDGMGSCDVPQTILVGGSYTCTYVASVASDAPGVHTNVVTATAVDDDGTAATDDDDATVDILATTSKIAPTQTTCQQYRDGTALDYTALAYNVSKGKIGSVAPGVIFFWSTITAPSESFVLEGHQLNDSGTLAWKDMSNLDVFLWSSDCLKVQTVTLGTSPDGHPTLSVTGATPGATYYFSVKYDTSSLTGTPVVKVAGKYPTVNYTFQTWLDGSFIVTSPDSVAVAPKK